VSKAVSSSSPASSAAAIAAGAVRCGRVDPGAVAVRMDDDDVLGTALATVWGSQ